MTDRARLRVLGVLGALVLVAALVAALVIIVAGAGAGMFTP